MEPDIDRYPHDPTVIGQCRRFAANRELLDHPQRLNYPMKRVGARGSGQWQRVSWDEALGDIATRLEDLKSRYGAESLATCISAPHTMYWPLHRFLNLWGSPNNVGIGIVCWNPRIWVNSITYGWPIEDELDPGTTRCVILWGFNPAESDRSLFWKTVQNFAAAGGKVLVIDPRRTETADLASHWLAIRPGTDGALALGMLNVIVQEGLWDREFVQKWCSGFDRLADRVSAYTPEKVSALTGIPESAIVEVARLYATSRPAALFTGLGIDMSGIHCTQTLRAIAALRAITGNIDTPGASFVNDGPEFVPEVNLELSELFPASQRAKKLGADKFALSSYEGYERLSQFTKRHGKRLPMRYLTSAHPHLVWQAMLTGEPYPIRAMVSMASNPLLCQANTHLVHKALSGLDLLVVLDQFQTPTAMLADYVLPIAGSFEQPLMQMSGGVANLVYGGPAAMRPLYERRTDFDFWCELGKRCGQGDHWPWATVEAAMEHALAPAGMSLNEFYEAGAYAGRKQYHKHEAAGFATPSGKVELHSILLEEHGHDPLPAYTAADDAGSDFPLRLITGTRKHPYYASEFRQIECIRRRHPAPKAEISRATAERMGLKEGDAVWIETASGRVQQALTVVDMVDDVVNVEYGWWFPEEASSEPGLGGLWKANANVLTTADTARCDPILGQWDFRSTPCTLYRAERHTAIRVDAARDEDRNSLEALLAENGMGYAEPIDLFVLARQGDEVVGCIRIEDSPEMAMVRPVVVAATHRSRGIGRLLVEATRPTDKPTLVVARGEAISFYRNLGFTSADWHMIPRGHHDECTACDDRQNCRPQPMRYDPASIIKSSELSMGMTAQ